MRFLLLPFVVLPILELMVLIKVGSLIGVLPTVGLVLLTAVIGVALLRRQGLATLLRANQRIQDGEVPAREVIEGFVLAVGGVLLVSPGFITDCLGLVCLLPGSRHWLINRLLKRSQVSGGGIFFGAGSGARRGRSGNGHGNVVIEGEFDHEREGREGRPDSLGSILDHEEKK